MAPTLTLKVEQLHKEIDQEDREDMVRSWRVYQRRDAQAFDNKGWLCKHQKQFPVKCLRRRNDIDRRRAVGHLMRWRVHKGVEEEGAEAKWFYITDYEKNRPEAKENQLSKPV